MDKIERYKNILRKEMEYQASLSFGNAADLHRHLIIGKDEMEFLLILKGWQDEVYRHGVIFHFEIINDKVWLHENNTDSDIGTKLAELGIPKSDIVLGFVSNIEKPIEGYSPIPTRKAS